MLSTAAWVWITTTKALPMLERTERVGGWLLSDRYKLPVINPGTYSLESFSHKLQGPDQGNVHQ